MKIEPALFATRPFVFFYGAFAAFAVGAMVNGDQKPEERIGATVIPVASASVREPAASAAAVEQTAVQATVSLEPAHEPATAAPEASSAPTGNAVHCDVYDIADCASVSQEDLFQSTITSAELKAKCASGEFINKKEYFCGWKLERAKKVGSGVWNTCGCTCMNACDVPLP